MWITFFQDQAGEPRIPKISLSLVSLVPFAKVHVRSRLIPRLQKIIQYLIRDMIRGTNISDGVAFASLV